MSFMKLQTMRDQWYAVEGRDGTDYLPFSVCGELDGFPNGETVDDDHPQFAEWCRQLRDYVECGAIESIEYIGEKYAARYSAPGYMDCTDWELGDTLDEAIEEAKEMYGDDEDDADDDTDDDECDDEPQEEDYIFTDSGTLGGKTSVTHEGKHIGEFVSMDEALAFVSRKMDKEQFFPSMWFITDHGNTVCIDRQGNEIK